MSTVFDRAERAEVPLLIAFCDLTGFAMQSARLADDQLAATIDELYEQIAGSVAAAGGHTVKFIGDAALVVFAEDDVERGVEALLALKQDVDRFLGERGWACQMHVKAHFGVVIAGPFGGRGDKRFDVIGKQVNAAAMLDSTGVALSAEAFDKLSPATRQRFKQHTWPVTYIRTEDPHRFRKR